MTSSIEPTLSPLVLYTLVPFTLLGAMRLLVSFSVVSISFLFVTRKRGAQPPMKYRPSGRQNGPVGSIISGNRPLLTRADPSGLLAVENEQGSLARFDWKVEPHNPDRQRRARPRGVDDGPGRERLARLQG